MTEDELHEAALNAAPSELRADEPTFARLLGLAGLGLTVLGSAAVIANQYGPRFVGTSGGIVFAFFGILALLFHAFRDGDVEFRRLYSFAGLALLVVALGVSLLPGKPADSTVERQVGYYLMPWGPLAAALALLFLTAATRHEPTQSGFMNTILLAVAAALTVAPVVIGMARPELLAGPGIVLSLVGVAYACAYLGRIGTADGVGRLACVALGLVGGLALYFAVARSVFPIVLSDGPRGLKTAAQSYDFALLGGRLLMVLVLAGLAYCAATRADWPGYSRVLTATAFGTVGLVLLIGAFATPLEKPLSPFLVPGGFILGLLGIIYLCVALAYGSDSPFVALVTREVAGFFVSPIAYLVLFGFSIVAALSYGILLLSFSDRIGAALPEPILGQYWGATMGAAFVVVVLVPVITMRLFSEEKRTGTLEVLLTAPVGEWQVVLSKFLATWFFYLIVWVPLGLYLVGLRAAGNAFDYRPMISYYLCQAACGAGFVAMGLFFSALTRNQIIAAVLTFTGMFAWLLTIILRSVPLGEFWQPVKSVAARLDYFTAWQSALSGQLSISFIVIYVSVALFWLVATVKVLEARRWS